MTEKVEDKQVEEKQTGPSKSFMTIGPTLHYSHANVRRCWILAALTYFATCSFWSKIMTGNMTWIGLPDLFNSQFLNLGDIVVSPLSIFEYPWQIYVLGLLMGIISVSPVIVSQLLSFRFCIPMILATIFVAKMPLFGVFLLISCVAVACRPLRFRSRFIAIALCMSPQMIYWALFGDAENVDPIKWGFSYSPWVCAWLTGLFIAAVVNLIGHYTRYKPGLVWLVTMGVLIWSVVVFQMSASFDELDYQLYIAGDNPEKVDQFQDRLMTESLDDVIRDNEIRSFLARLFYPDEPILLREELKRELQWGLDSERWPVWFKVSKELDYNAKRLALLNQYETFLTKRPKSDRVPIALYYKGMLSEYKPDVSEFSRSEKLHFSNDVPQEDTTLVWLELFQRYSLTPESLEARWRIATIWAGKGYFQRAEDLCRIASTMLANQLGEQELEAKEDTIWTAFSPPPKTVMTKVKLQELWLRLRKLERLLGKYNIGEDEASKDRLAKFIRLDKYKMDYASELEKLLIGMKEDDPLLDNVLLSQAMLHNELHKRGEKLMAITEKHGETDGGIQAKFELGLLNVRLWKETEDQETRDKHLNIAKMVLKSCVKDDSQSIFKEEAQAMLDSLPGE